MSNLVSRLLTAVIACPVILWLLYGLPWWGFGLLAYAAMCVAALEFFGLTHPGDRADQVFGWVLSSCVFGALVSTRFGSGGTPFDTRIAVGTLVGLMPAAMLFTLFRPGTHATALMRTGALVLGPMYVGSTLAAVTCLRQLGTHNSDGAGLVVLTLMVSWFSDTAGYFVGKNVKGPKLYPSVSPNKTWSGSIGGVFGSMLGALFAHFVYLRSFPLGAGLLWAGVAGAVGQTGDLCESLLKRSAGVKDSGGILPGHGGILDRLDAMMFAALVLYGAMSAGWLTLAAQ